MMTERQGKLKLGKGSAFVKRRLLWLPQESVSREVDFCPLPASINCGRALWLGLVVSPQDGSLLAEVILQQPPTVNDFADILAESMFRPLTDGTRCRPEGIFLRDNPEWEELFPHLEQLKIKVVVTEDLQVWDEIAEATITYMEKQQAHGSKPHDFRDTLLNLQLAAIFFSAKWNHKAANEGG